MRCDHLTGFGRVGTNHQTGGEVGMIKERQAVWDRWIELKKQFENSYEESNLISVAGGMGIQVKAEELLFLPGVTKLETDHSDKYPHQISKTYKGYRFFAFLSDTDLDTYQAQEAARDIFLSADDKKWLDRLAEAEQALNTFEEELANEV